MTAALEGGEWSAARPGRTLPPLPSRKDPVPILQEAGWVWTSGISRPHRNSIPDRPARSSVAIPTELPGPRIKINNLLVISYVINVVVFIKVDTIYHLSKILPSNKRLRQMKTLNWMLQAGPPSLHYYCAVVLHSYTVLPPVGHSSNHEYHEYHCCHLTDNRAVFRIFIWLLRFSFDSSSYIQYTNMSHTNWFGFDPRPIHWECVTDNVALTYYSPRNTGFRLSVFFHHISVLAFHSPRTLNKPNKWNHRWMKHDSVIFCNRWFCII